MADLAPFRSISPGSQPPYDAPAYHWTAKRHPRRALHAMPPTISGTTGLGTTGTGATGPFFPAARFPVIADLTMVTGKPALGERIIVAGTVTGEDGQPVPGAMIEVWQANAAGRHDHPEDQHDAPLDPNFRGAGRVFTDAEGRYRFVTIRPGVYAWENHRNAWRPAHIHFSVAGPNFAARLVTQMYFPGDPLLTFDPVFHAVPEPAARNRMIARFDLDLAQPNWALGYRFDIVLPYRCATPDRQTTVPIATASQTIGHHWHLIQDVDCSDLTSFGAEGERIALTGAVRDGDGAPCTDACVEIWQADPPASDRFPGFGRARTDERGMFHFRTVKPGPVPARAGDAEIVLQAPHIPLRVLARGLMRDLVTRVYFQHEPRNEADPLLNSIDDPERRATLIARPDGAAAWRLDIRLQGTDETVFLAI
jgi:protocatechuate 3,4-dioxygenase beta subunit